MENIVYITAPRDWFDYLATGATLLLSAIAVIIAVGTARRQNKIALFEKRYDVYDQLFECITNLRKLTESLYTLKNAENTKTIIKENILRREGIIITRIEQIEEFSDAICLEYYFKRSILDMKYIQQAGLIFHIDSVNTEFLKYLTVGYSQLRPQMIEVLQGQRIQISVEDIEVQMPDLLTNSRDALAEQLGKQMKISKK
jgi:hypothetical protein